MGYYEETREIYVKVNSKEDYDTVKKIFEKYEISTECINDIKVIYNVYVYMDEDDFQEFRYEIYEAVADCLVFATCDKYHSVGGSCGYEIFSHYPNQEDWDEHYLCDDENSCPVGVYGINDLKSCLDFIHRAQLKLDVASKVAIYKIWGENIDEETFTAVENDDSAETFLKSLIINNPVTVGNLSRKSKTIYRLCAIAKDDEIMQLIKNGIKECVNKGDEIVSKATYISDKQMMYFVAADFYESDYQGKIEYAVNDLLEKAKGKFIILVDCFVAYNEDDYYSEEGYAECSLGSDMKYFSWDCCTYDEEMEDNFDVNITDVLGYLNTYGFEMEYDEKVFISSFKYDNDSDIQKIQSAREAVAGDLRVRAKEGYDASLKAWEEENKKILEKREAEKCKAQEKLNPFNAADMKKIWSYSILEDGTIEITGYNGKEENITIPERIGKKTVTSIADQAFSSAKDRISNERENVLKNLKFVTIPDSVEYIGSFAFECCFSLINVFIGKGVKRIGRKVFCNCYNLTEINVDINNKKYTSIDGILYNKDKTKLLVYPLMKKENNFVVPDSVTSIGEYAFENCEDITNITLSKSIKSIEDGAFTGCEKLTDIILPDGIT